MQVGGWRQNQFDIMRFQQIAGFPCPKIGIHEIQIDHPDMGLRPPASQRQVDGDFRLATAGHTVQQRDRESAEIADERLERRLLRGIQHKAVARLHRIACAAAVSLLTVLLAASVAPLASYTVTVSGLIALLLQWWTNAIDYPFLISGKPLNGIPEICTVCPGSAAIHSI